MGVTSDQAMAVDDQKHMFGALGRMWFEMRTSTSRAFECKPNHLALSLLKSDNNWMSLLRPRARKRHVIIGCTT